MVSARSTTAINGQPVRSLMARMLIHSDNRATDILLKDVGGPTALHDWLQSTTASPAFVSTAPSRSCSRAKRDLWDRRNSSTPMAMVELLRRIYKAELIKPESRNYLLDLMAAVPDRQEPDEVRCCRSERRSSTRRARSTGSATTSASSPCPTATASPSRSSPAAARDRPRTIAEAARAIYDGFKSVFDLAVRRAAPSHASRCCSTSSLAERSAALRRPSWSSAI